MRNKVSDDLRKLIISNYNDGSSLKQLTVTFALPKSTVNSILKTYKKDGRIEKLPRGGQRFSKTNADMKQFIRDEVDKKCDITLKTLSKMVFEKFQVNLSHTTIDNCLKGFHYSLKRIKIFATRSISPEILQQRKKYASDFQDLLANKNERNIFFIDEVGFNVSMRSKYGRACIGQTPIRHVPGIRSRNISVCCAMNKCGNTFYQQQTSAFNVLTFHAYIEALMTWISEKQLSQCTFVMDNVPFHKNKNIQNVIVENGHDLRFLPAYTPQFNPIENMFSKWKNHIRKSEPKNEMDLYVLIKNGLNTITEDDCNGFFRNILKEMRSI